MKALTDKLLALFWAGWAKIVATYRFLANQTIDPPPARAKAYFWVAVAMLAFGWLMGATILSGVKSVLAPVYQAAKPLPLIAPTDVVISVPPPAAIEAPRPVATLPPLAKLITLEPVKAPVADKKAKRATRKPKCQTVFC